MGFFWGAEVSPIFLTYKDVFMEQMFGCEMIEIRVLDRSMIGYVEVYIAGDYGDRLDTIYSTTLN